METTQGTDTLLASAPLEGAVEPASATTVPDSLLTADTSAAPSNAQQGGTQGVQGQSDVETRIRELQSLADKRLAEQYQLQQQLQQTQAQMMDIFSRQQTAQTQSNPFDPQTQPEQWWDWKLQQNNRSLLAEAEKAYENKLMNVLRQSSEMQWAQAHPGVDVNAVKAFAQMRGIQNLEDAHTLMTLPNRMTQVAAQASTQTANNFRQPITGAQPLRSQQGVTPSNGKTYDFNALLQASAKDPSVLDKIPVEDKEEFLRVVKRMQREL